MRIKLAFLIIIFIGFIGCEKDEIDFNEDLPDGFCIVSNDEVVLNHFDIEYYDCSSHLIYLKDNKSFADDIESIGDFKVFANREEIYSGRTYSGFSSFFPSGPYIPTDPSFYGDYIVPIGFNQITDTLGNSLDDLRGDERIVQALKKYNQFHAGLSCEIKSIQYLSVNNVKVELLLKNNDSFNYYYLDPDKTGIGLFHYFTNGLFIRAFNSFESYTHKIEIISADPWNLWKRDWLSIINGNESKTIIITYENFEVVEPGLYKATFEYPGLSFQIDKKDILQENGQIWLGKLNMVKEITIE